MLKRHEMCFCCGKKFESGEEFGAFDVDFGWRSPVELVFCYDIRCRKQAAQYAIVLRDYMMEQIDLQATALMQALGCYSVARKTEFKDIYIDHWREMLDYHTCGWAKKQGIDKELVTKIAERLIEWTEESEKIKEKNDEWV